MKRFARTCIVMIAVGCAWFSTPAPIPCAVPDDPPVFSDSLDVDNQFTPLPPGRMRIYGLEDCETENVIVVDLVLHETRTFQWNGADVECRILQTLDFEDGRLVGVSDQFLAQADNGSVYFFGEITSTYVDEDVVVHFGSWLVGGPTLPSDPPFAEWRADPTIFMLAQPQLGDAFKREDIPPILDETNTVTALGLAVSVPGGAFEDAMELTETSLFELDKRDTKIYAPGTGVVKAIDVDETLVLLALTPQGAIPAGIDFWSLID